MNLRTGLRVPAFAAVAIASGIGLCGTASADPGAEANFLAKVHQYAQGQGVTGTDAQFLDDGYYACHLTALGPASAPPAAYGISPLITTYALQFLCPEQNHQ